MTPCFYNGTGWYSPEWHVPCVLGSLKKDGKVHTMQPTLYKDDRFRTVYKDVVESGGGAVQFYEHLTV